VIFYTLNVSVQGNAIAGAVLQDTLPADETFVAFGQSPGGTITSQAGGVLQWVLPSPLAPGTYPLTYQAKVNDFLATGEVLVNQAQLSAPSQAPITAAANVVVVGTYKVTVSVYNEAGELIKQIEVLQLTEPVSNLQWPSGTTISGLNQALPFYDLGHLIGQWDGTNSSGNPVSNGVYHVQVSSVDPTGVVNTVTQEVTVSRTLTLLSADIYNEAGEIVRHLYSGLSDTNNPAPLNLQLSGTVINPESSLVNGALPSSITINLGDGVSFAWDGRSDSGAWVSNGQYYLELHTSDGPGNETQIRQITVEGSASSGIFSAQPNILKPNQTATLFRADSTTPLTLQARIYNLAGELVKVIPGTAGTNQAGWDASGTASGLYFVELEGVDASGKLIGKQILKVLVVR
jgi:flagellar hook assembly protein FlgD